MDEATKQLDVVAIGEAQLILAEKRTSLAVLRTGITVLVLPLSVVSVLIATSKYYDIFHVFHFIVPLMALNTCLVILGAYLIIRATIRLHRFDRLIKQIKEKRSNLSEILD